MSKKFWLLSLALFLSPHLQAQQTQNYDSWSKQISQQDLTTLTKAIEQLPDKQQTVILENFLGTSDTARLTVTQDVILAVVMFCLVCPYLIYQGFFKKDNWVKNWMYDWTDNHKKEVDHV